MKLRLEDNIIKTEDLQFDENVGGIGIIYYEHMKKFWNLTAQIDTQSKIAENYKSLLTKCVRTALRLKDKGINKGDIIALCSDHHLNACVPIIAAHFIGAIPFSFDPSHFISDCVSILKIVQPKVTFIINKCKDLIESALKEAEVESDLIIFGEQFDKEFLQAKSNENNFAPIYVNNLQETAILYFTSGSTGTPKAIQVSHYTMMTLVGSLINDPERDRLFRVEHPIFIHFTSWYWASSGFFLFTYTVKGGCRILCNNYEPTRLWRLIAKYKINGVFLSPLRTIEFYKSERPKDVDVSSWEILFHGGSSLSREHVLGIRSALPGVHIIQGYGQTETGLLVHFGNTYDDLTMKYVKEKPGCLGLPVKGVWYKIVDVDTEKNLGFNQPGELRVKSKQVTNGYYKLDSSSCFDKNGWYKTGDILYFDEDFCFYFVERITEILKCRDWHVFPVQVENVLIKHPAVYSAVVIGQPHDVEGYHLMGVVVLNKNHETVTEDDLLNFVERRVNARQKLKAGIKIVSSLPMTITGKISRRLTREMVLNKKEQSSED